MATELPQNRFHPTFRSLPLAASGEAVDISCKMVEDACGSGLFATYESLFNMFAGLIAGRANSTREEA